MTDSKTLKAEAFKNENVKAAYEGMADEFSLASAIIRARAFADLTQEELANKMGAKQSLVTRIESGSLNTTVKTLLQVAKATGTHLKITFEH